MGSWYSEIINQAQEVSSLWVKRSANKKAPAMKLCTKAAARRKLKTHYGKESFDHYWLLGHSIIWRRVYPDRRSICIESKEIAPVNCGIRSIGHFRLCAFSHGVCSTVRNTSLYRCRDMISFYAALCTSNDNLYASLFLIKELMMDPFFVDHWNLALFVSRARRPQKHLTSGSPSCFTLRSLNVCKSAWSETQG